jgi:hypothetical protein
MILWMRALRPFLGLVCLFFLLACAPVTPPPQFSAPASPFPPVQETPWVTPSHYAVQFAWFYKPPLDESLLPALPQYYDFFILTHRDETQRDALQTFGVRQPIPAYLLFAEIHDPGNCETRPRGNQVAYLPGDFCRISAEHPDWFLLDADGTRIVDDDNYYNMDFGNPGFRTFWLERARALQATHGWQGFFLDNVEASLSKLNNNGHHPQQYPDDASLQLAVDAFLAEIRSARLGPLYANIIAMKNPAVWARYLSHLDGALLENFAVGWRGQTLSLDEWQTQMNMIAESQRFGKKVIAVAQGDRDDLKRQQFAYASYLLVNDGQVFFRYAHHSAYREIWWYENYEIDLGRPLGEAHAENGIWTREFEHGRIRLDPARQVAEIVQE